MIRAPFPLARFAFCSSRSMGLRSFLRSPGTLGSETVSDSAQSPSQYWQCATRSLRTNSLRTKPIKRQAEKTETRQPRSSRISSFLFKVSFFTSLSVGLVFAGKYVLGSLSVSDVLPRPEVWLSNASAGR